jgi:hypothetical protein
MLKSTVVYREIVSLPFEVFMTREDLFFILLLEALCTLILGVSLTGIFVFLWAIGLKVIYPACAILWLLIGAVFSGGTFFQSIRPCFIVFGLLIFLSLWSKHLHLRERK